MTEYIQQFPSVIKQLKEWSELNEVEVLFDSRIHSWEKSTSEFGTKVKGKKNVAIIIEDMDGNIFGGYIVEEIGEQNVWVEDFNAFLFSIESNRRIPQPTKYPIKGDKAKHAFLIFDDDFEYLFQFGYGYDIVVCKQNHSTNFNSGVNETSFGFQKIKNPLCSGKTFVASRIVALEMK